jgi:hypothetical protein
MLLFRQPVIPSSILDELVELDGRQVPIGSLPVVSGLERALDEFTDFVFVRIVSSDLLMFIWDQLVLSRFEWFPNLCVALLLCVRSQLLESKSSDSFLKVRLSLAVFAH